MISLNVKLEPIKYEQSKYYDQVILWIDNYPSAFLHIDTFWPGHDRESIPHEKYVIYDALNEGKTVLTRFDIVPLEILDGTEND